MTKRTAVHDVHAPFECLARQLCGVRKARFIMNVRAQRHHAVAATQRANVRARDPQLWTAGQRDAHVAPADEWQLGHHHTALSQLRARRQIDGLASGYAGSTPMTNRPILSATHRATRSGFWVLLTTISTLAMCVYGWPWHMVFPLLRLRSIPGSNRGQHGRRD